MNRRQSKRDKQRGRDLDDSCAKLSLFLGKDETVPQKISFTEGRPVSINTNVYKLALRGGSTLFQYDVTLIPEILNSKLITMFVYKALCPDGGRMSENQKWQHIIFDGQRIIYSPIEGLDGEVEIEPRKDSDKKVIVKISQTRRVEADDAESLISIYNTAFHKAYISLGLNAFRRKWINEKDCLPAGSFKIFQGFIPSIVSLSGGMSYLLDCATRIDRDGTLYDFLKLGIDKESERESLEIACRSMQITTTHRPKRPRQVIVKKVNWSKFASQYTFEREDRRTKQKETITIEQYYKEVYNIDCKPNDILIEMVTRVAGQDKVDVFPSSVLKISGISDAERKNGLTMKTIGAVTKIKPQVRKERLDAFIKSLKENSQASSFLNSWGFDIGESTRITGRVISPPKLLFSTKDTQKPQSILLNDQLKFQNQFKENAMYEGAEITSSILIIAPAEHQANVEGDFLINLKKVSRNLSLKLPEIDPRRHCGFLTNTNPNDYCNFVANYMKDLPIDKLPQFVICILPGQEKYRYDKIKHFLSVELGIPSQCVKAQTLFDKVKIAIISNLALQIATKLGGVPFRVDIPLGKTMVVGLALSTSRGTSPVCAGTCSFDYGLTHFYSKSKALSKGENVIPDDFLHELIEEGLKKFYTRNGAFPKNVIVYRDGVSYGQMPKLKQQEVTAISDKIKETTGVDDTSLVYMIAQKHGSIRILKEEGNFVENAGAGTVIVDNIGAKDVAEFYMISHFANQGSASPTRYTIIHHFPIHWEDDKLIELTHYQTLQYPNWSGSIRIPSCLMLASRLAEMSKSHLGSDNPKEHLADKLHFL